MFSSSTPQSAQNCPSPNNPPTTGVENRPIISGNFLRQPCVRVYLGGEERPGVGSPTRSSMPAFYSPFGERKASSSSRSRGPSLLPEDYPGAEVIHERGFFIGVHQIELDETEVDELVRIMLSFAFEQRETVLVTGSKGMLGCHVRELVAAVQERGGGRNTPKSSTPKNRNEAGVRPLGGGDDLLVHGETGLLKDRTNRVDVVDENNKEELVLAGGPGNDPLPKGKEGEVANGRLGATSTESGQLQQLSGLNLDNCDFVFADRSHADLADLAQVEALFKMVQPTIVLHCAAKLASVGEMSKNPVDYFLENVSVNNNILRTSDKFASWVGPIKVISVLSTVAFGNPPPVAAESENANVEAEHQLLTSADVCRFEPHPACESYAYAKRMLLKLSSWYRESRGCRFFSVLPGNFYGEHGRFEDMKTAPLVGGSSLI